MKINYSFDEDYEDEIEVQHVKQKSHKIKSYKYEDVNELKNKNKIRAKNFKNNSKRKQMLHEEYE